MGYYETKDGRWLALSMLDEARYWAPLCAAVDASDLADDPLFATAADRLANRAALRDRLRDEFAGRDLEHWRERLDATGCVYAVLATVPEVLDDPQVRANGYLVQHPEHGHVRPGMFCVGGDSHSPTGGAFGAYMFGIGSTEMLGVAVSGQISVTALRTVQGTCFSTSRDLTTSSVKVRFSPL